MQIDELENLFWEEHEREPFSPVSIALFSFITHRIKQTRLRGPVMLTWSQLQAYLNVSSAGTISRAIKELTDRNIIVYGRKKNRSTFWLYGLQEGQQENHYDNRSDMRSDYRSEQCSDMRSEPCSNSDSTDNVTIPVEVTENRTDTSKTDVFSDDFLSQFSDFELKKESSKERNIFNNINNNNINNINNKIQDNPIKQGLSQNLQANPEIIPPWKVKLNKYERDIIDTWETVIGEFSPEWVPKVKQVLQACYPMQVKNAITTMARTKGEVMMTEGFPYLAEPLLKGAFGKRTTKAKQQKQPDSVEKRYAGLIKFLQKGNEGIPGW